MQGNEALGKLSPAKPHLTNCEENMNNLAYIWQAKRLILRGLDAYPRTIVADDNILSGRFHPDHGYELASQHALQSAVQNWIIHQDGTGSLLINKAAKNEIASLLMPRGLTTTRSQRRIQLKSAVVL